MATTSPAGDAGTIHAAEIETPSTSVPANGDDQPSQGEAAKAPGRKPDCSVGIGRIWASAWHDRDRGWSFRLSRSFPSKKEQGKSEWTDIALYGPDLLNAATVLQKLAEATVLQIRQSGPF